MHCRYLLGSQVSSAWFLDHYPSQPLKERSKSTPILCYIIVSFCIKCYCMLYLVSLGFVASIQPRDWLERSSNDTQRYRGVYLHRDRVEEVDIVLCSVCSVFFFFSYHSCPHRRCVNRAARPVIRVERILAVETAAKILLRSGNLLDGRSGLGCSDQPASHGLQAGVQKVWVSLLWTVPY